jgi:hypothetical protein
MHMKAGSNDNIYKSILSDMRYVKQSDIIGHVGSSNHKTFDH